jgi:hypothetical protein
LKCIMASQVGTTVCHYVIWNIVEKLCPTFTDRSVLSILQNAALLFQQALCVERLINNRFDGSHSNRICRRKSIKVYRCLFFFKQKQQQTDKTRVQPHNLTLTLLRDAFHCTSNKFEIVKIVINT